MNKIHLLLVRLFALLLLITACQKDPDFTTPVFDSVSNALTNQLSVERDTSSAVFYLPVPRVVLDVPEGHDHDHEEENPEPGRPAQHMPDPSALWNHSSFHHMGDLAISSELSEGIESRGVCATPITEASLESVYAGAKAHMPLYLPYRHSNVGIWQGFYYNWGDKHGAIDYGKASVAEGEDPTFGIYAIASGVVTETGWSDGGGNYVTIEHTAPNGFKYLSKYIHLRDGFSHDLQKAKNVPQTSDGLKKYRKFANQANPSTKCWGTESQTIAVVAGQQVAAGQFIAWAGNTGSGGIGIILNDDGALKNANTRSFNVHLHFTLYIKDTRPGKTGWVSVDPYGVYNKKDGIACYDLDSETPYNRLFAPFYPSFHNVPLHLVNKYWGYYTGMGMALQTLSTCRQNGNLMASGSFQWGLPNAWYARFYMTASVYQDYFNQYGQAGFRPRQIQVSDDSQGNPRFSVIWEKQPAGQSSFAYHNRSDQNFNNLWKEYITQKKWHIAEHVTYTVNGQRYHAGIFVNKPGDNGFYMYYGLSAQGYNQKFNELKSQWQPGSLHVDGSAVGGVWRPIKQGYMAYFGMTAAEYQQRFDQAGASGMRLFRVQSYQNSGRFAAIWVK